MRKEEVKAVALELGADLCGIAAAKDFSGAPPGHHPQDLLPSCRAVIVLGRSFPATAMEGGSLAYTQVRDQLSETMSALAESLAARIGSLGAAARVQRPLGCTLEEDGRFRAALSLKHAAALAGLGTIGRNTLLVNERFGNMVWFSAVLTDLALAADPPATYAPCSPDCRACVNACPVGALNSPLLAQLTCYNNAYRVNSSEESIHCWACRRACPNYLGGQRVTDASILANQQTRVNV